ncbi:DUF695 domain-containing protein [Ferruginibacter sp. SUN106]|uniref:DUF695 domain-containing protein n=1 Tax=Ferruginibacter sp. SUN106 TaxID=2978348 RepID=UPI003D36B3AF
MSFLKKLFGGKKAPQPIETPTAFWNWFLQQEPGFYTAIKSQDKAAEKLQQIIDQLQQLNPELYGLVGMYDDNTAELIITPDGDIKNIAFAEDIVTAAPAIKGWRITALKPETGFGKSTIRMNGYDFNSEKIKFFAITDPGKPDEIEIHIVHEDYAADRHDIIGNGSLIYLDNAVGEIMMATQIDDIYFDPPGVNEELIPIEKLKDYLIWREKEFIEKYDGVRYDTENDNYSGLEAKDENDLPMVAIVNQQLLSWDAKASHPWMLAIDIAYKGNETGMPDETTYALMDKFEEALMEKLHDFDGYLNAGRQTYNNERTIFFACKEFRECSRVTFDCIKAFQNQLSISYTIYKDKYWKTLDRFQ